MSIMYTISIPKNVTLVTVTKVEVQWNLSLDNLRNRDNLGITAVSMLFQYVEMDLTNKTTYLRIQSSFDSPLGVPNYQVSLYVSSSQ